MKLWSRLPIYRLLSRLPPPPPRPSHFIIACIPLLQLTYHTHYGNSPIQIYRNFTSKNWKFQMKNYDIFQISAQNMDCGYSLEPPRRGGSNEYPQSMFLSRNKKNNVYPCKPQFYYIKVGFKGVKIIYACFRVWLSFVKMDTWSDFRYLIWISAFMSSGALRQRLSLEPLCEPNSYVFLY